MESLCISLFSAMEKAPLLEEEMGRSFVSSDWADRTLHPKDVMLDRTDRRTDTHTGRAGRVDGPTKEIGTPHLLIYLGRAREEAEEKDMMKIMK